MLRLVVFSVLVLAMADAGLVAKRQVVGCVRAEMYKVTFPSKTYYRNGDTVVKLTESLRQIMDLNENKVCTVDDIQKRCRCNDLAVSEKDQIVIEDRDVKGKDAAMVSIGPVETYNRTEDWHMVITKKVTKDGCVLVYREKAKVRTQYSIIYDRIIAREPPVLSLTDAELEYFNKPDYCQEQEAYAPLKVKGQYIDFGTHI